MHLGLLAQMMVIHGGVLTPGVDQKGITRTEGKGTGEDRDKSYIWRIC